MSDTYTQIGNLCCLIMFQAKKKKFVFSLFCQKKKEKWLIKKTKKKIAIKKMKNV